MISTARHLRGYVRPLARLTVAGQVEALNRFGIVRERIYVEGAGPESLEAMTRALRKGEAVAVVRLHILAPPKLRTIDRPRRELWAAIQAIEAKGAHIIEVDSGRSTSSKSERDDMIADAIEALTHAGRSPRRRDGAGRPPMDVDDTKEAARVVWFSREYRTNADAIRAGPAKWKEWRYYRNFGPSGRDN